MYQSFIRLAAISVSKSLFSHPARPHAPVCVCALLLIKTRMRTAQRLSNFNVDEENVNFWLLFAENGRRFECRLRIRVARD